MLKIRLNGYHLNISDDIQINLIIENPLVLTNRIPVPNTLSFELKATPTNLKATGYPNRATSKNSFLKSEDFEMEHSSIIFLTGTFIVLGFDKTIKCQVLGVVMSEFTKKKLYEADLQQYDFGRGSENYPKFTTAGYYGYTFAAAIQNSIPGAGNFVAAPVKLAGVEYDPSQGGAGRPVRSGTENPENGNIMADQLYINYFNPRIKTYWPKDYWYPWIYPMTYLHYIVDNLFSTILETNPFSTGELANLVLITSFHPSWPRRVLLDNNFPKVPPGVGTGGRPTRVTVNNVDDIYKADTFFKLNSFLPDMAANEFLKSLLNLFCATLFPVKGKFKMLYNKDIMNDPTVDSWTGKLIGKLSIYKQEIQTYSYGYAGSNNDDTKVTGEFVVNSIQDLISLDVSAINESDFEVTTTGQVFTKTLVDTDVFYDLKKSGLGGNQGGDNAFDMTSQLTPITMNLNRYWWQETNGTADLEKAFWYVPEIEASRTTRPASASIGFYRGLKASFTAGDEYPFLTSHNYDHFGNRLGDISLNWDGPDGLIAKYHQEFKTWIEKEKSEASGEFLLTPLDLRNVDLTIKKNIEGKLYYVKIINVTLLKYSIKTAQVEFIEA